MKIIKVIGILLGVVLLAGAGFYGWAVASVDARLAKTYDVKVPSVAVPTDAASIEHGKHLVQSLGGCTHCHGEDLGGAVEADVPPIVLSQAPNITQGEGSVTKGFTDEDYVRAIRHGIKKDGRPLFFMPSSAFINLSEKDLGSIIAAVKSYPPVNRPSGFPKFYPVGQILGALKMFPVAHAEMIDHTTKFPDAVTSGAGSKYGEYAVAAGGCRDCHRPDLSGGRIPGTPDSMPPAANLTPVGPVAKYSEADFITLFRTGKRPNGQELHEMMPWKSIGRMTDAELGAVYAYLKTLPAAETKD